jgi:hypothetical protein
MSSPSGEVRRLGGVLRHHRAVDDRAEIVAVEQRIGARAGGARGRHDRAQELVERHVRELGRIADAELLQHRVGQRIGALARREAHRRARLDHRAVEEALRGRHDQERADLSAAARLAEDRDVAGIAAKRGDVVAHPTERRDHVERAGIARPREAFAADVFQMQIAADVEPVVDADHDDIAALGEVGAVGDRAVARAIGERAAMQPHHDRPLAAAPGVQTLSVRQSSTSGVSSAAPRMLSISVRRLTRAGDCGAWP